MRWMFRLGRVVLVCAVALVALVACSGGNTSTEGASAEATIAPLAESVGEMDTNETAPLDNDTDAPRPQFLNSYASW